MRSVKTDLVLRPNTLKENKRVLCELRRRGKIDCKSFDETSRLVAKFNAKNALGLSKNAGASFGQKQEKKAGNLYGPVDGFPPGSWWGIRMDCSRDGVHEPFNQDLRQGPFGVVSLCTSHSNADNDVDLGDLLTLTGDEYRPVTGSVQPLLKNYQNRLPLRLIRSYDLSNDYAPKTGYRYDGLYGVAACWIGVTSEAEKHYKFALARLPYQAPPSWQLSRKSASSARIESRVQDTRRGVGRSSDGSKSRPNDEDATVNARPRSLMTKCPFPKFNSPSQESTIVTRCISKKSDGQSCGGPATVSLARTKALVSDANPSLRNESSTMCKFQNTNISIRTDLYDSSNVVSQEPRKTIPMTFCRTYKNSRLPGRSINHSNVVTLNLNSCGPCPRDSVQGSLIQSRSGIPKFSTGQSPSLDHVNEPITPKLSSIDHTELKTNLNDGRPDGPPIEEANAETGLGSSSESPRPNLSERKLVADEFTEKMSTVSLNSASAIADDARIAVQNNRKDCTSNVTVSVERMETSSLNADISSAEKEATNESHTDLDSLTPDEMLNFIVKQKCHPRAKLLIGSVIGLATGESTILRAYESLMSRNNLWLRDGGTRGEKNEIKSLQGKEDKLSSLGYDGEKNSPGKERDSKDITVSKSLRTKGAPRDSKDRLIRKRTLRRTRVSKRLMMGTEKKLSSSNLRQKNVASQRLRTSNLPELKKSQQPFSKSTVAKKSKKSVKKRRGELANLVIDAKIGPLIRGPRNRRLRCQSHIFTKKIHAPDNDARSSYCAKKPTGIGSNGKKEIGDVSTRKNKVAGLKPQISESRFNAANKRGHENERNCSESRGQPRGSVANASERDDGSKTRSVRGEKRKLSRSRETKIDGSRKILCGDLRENSEVQRVKMVDAATQCSTTRRDATTSVDREVTEKPLNSIKIEWIDVDDVKSEISEDDAARRSIHEDTLNFQEDHRVSSIAGDRSTGPRTDESPFQRSSAFVPVNTSDRDFRIARLRSIGFKPIRPDGIFGDETQIDMPDDEEESPSTSTEDSSGTTVVTSREVDELFNKYTSEETATVGYMDEELRYQDIEDEETGGKMGPRKNRNNYGVARRGRRIAKTHDCARDQSETEKNLVASSNEADSEVPWHGWKKFVKNKQAQWIGW